MRRVLPFLAAALASPLGMTSAAAATGDIGCIEAKLGPAAMQRIGHGAVVAGDIGGDPAGALDADREALIAARDVCKRANAWSAAATDVAISYTEARALQPSAMQALASDGADPQAVVAAYHTLSLADRRSFTAGISPAARRAVEAIAASRVDRRAARRHIIMLFSALSGVEFYPGEFARS